MQFNRKLTQKEAKLLKILALKASIILSEDWQKEILVSSMNDGDMGSFKIFHRKRMKTNRLFGKQVSECTFEDRDGIKVIASLNIDNYGDLYEVDIWKTDYTPIIELPDNF